MSTADLQDLAKMYGIDNAEEINGSELKKILITKFGLQEIKNDNIGTSQNQVEAISYGEC